MVGTFVSTIILSLHVLPAAFFDRWSGAGGANRGGAKLSPPASCLLEGRGRFTCPCRPAETVRGRGRLKNGAATGPPSLFFIEAKGNRRRCPPGQCGGMEQERSDHPSADFVCDGAPHITFSDARFHTQPAPQNMYADRAAAPGAGGSGPERDLRNVKRQRKIPETRRFRGFWQRVKDSNPHRRSQSPACYHYTNPLFLCAAPRATNRYYYTKSGRFVNPFFQKNRKI